MKSLSRRLRDAARLLDEVGWTVESFVDVDDNENIIGFCAVGSIAAASVGINRIPDSDDPAGEWREWEIQLDRAFPWIGDPQRPPHSAIETFNDNVWCDDILCACADRSESPNCSRTRKDDVQTLLLLLAEVLDSDRMDAVVLEDVKEQLAAIKIRREEPAHA